MLSLIILALVFILIAVRRVGFIRFRIWQIMLLGALGVLITQQISPLEAARSVNTDVILFLFGVFIVGRALEESGYLAHLASRFFGRAKTVDILVLFIIFGMGLLSALLMNDTLAIIGTPVVLGLAKKSEMPPKLLLLALAFAVTIGSVMSPIGNPQNLLIAIHGEIANPFITFFRFLFLPTLVNLLLAYWLLRLFYKRHFHSRVIADAEATITDVNLAKLAKVSLILLVAMVLLKIIIVFMGWGVDLKLTYIALMAALPIILLSRKRFGIVRSIDWSTLVFFAAMFVLMASVWNAGYFQQAATSLQINFASNSQIMLVSVLLSQLISNVPLVALYLPVLMGDGGSAGNLMALAAGSTIAGNLTILGAASNVIIIQQAEKNQGITLTLWDFVRVGVPLTLINVMVYWFFLS
ncbi:MAG: anion transporter [Chloroflexi bacterium RBG_16_51_9]|nr:MAG: anion transporter [Chloroflexi bacterium RBG_16_51_9]